MRFRTLASFGRYTTPTGIEKTVYPWRKLACGCCRSMNVTYIGFLTNSIIDHIVIFNNLLLDCKCQVLHTSLLLLEVDVAETTVEEYFARVELEE